VLPDLLVSCVSNERDPAPGAHQAAADTKHDPHSDEDEDECVVVRIPLATPAGDIKEGLNETGQDQNDVKEHGLCVARVMKANINAQVQELWA
jgi:hypothetical protein